MKSPRFALPCLYFDYPTEAVSHTRNLTFLKKHIRGADFDLEAIWEEYCYFEFKARSGASALGIALLKISRRFWMLYGPVQ
jgi:carboxymethylenebutenolidase